MDKKPFLERVVQLAREQGHRLGVCHVGDMMYAETPDVAPGRILDLPLSRLNALRRSVFKDILSAAGRAEHLLVNTHATFRWRHGLFYGFDYDQMKSLDADLYVVLVDNIDRIHYRLTRDGHTDHTLKDLMVWREEEVLATELLSQIVRGHGRFYIMSRGESDSAAQAMVRLMIHPGVRKVYLSFPMSHINGNSQAGPVVAQIEEFRRQMKRFFTCFDPGDLEEKYLAALALDAAREGRRTIQVGPPGEQAIMETSQLLDVIADIDGQIYARYFKLIDQAEMIVSFIPVMPDGRPCISSGVERELQHAHEAAKDVFVIWQNQVAPSPFITETATRVFGSLKEAMEHFHASGSSNPPLGTLFSLL